MKSREYDDISRLLEGLEMVFRRQQKGLVIDMFPSADDAQAWVDALAKSLRNDLLAPNGVKFDASFPVNAAVLGHVAGETSPVFKRVEVDPTQTPVDFAATLAHELVHTGQYEARPRMTNEEAHDAEFGANLAKLGLLPPWTASEAGPAFKEWYRLHAPKPEEYGARTK